MSPPQLLLCVILIQQALFCALWLAAAHLKLARRAAVHWAAMAGLAGAGVGLILLRGQAPTWLAVGVANLLILAGFIALRRGVQRFARQPPSDTEHGLLLVLGTAGVLTLALAPAQTLLAVLALVTAIVWTTARAAYEVRRHLAHEFGRFAALLCAMPLAAVALLFVARTATAPFAPGVYSNYLQHPGGNHSPAVLVATVFSLLLQLALVALVVLRLVQRLRHQSDHDPLTGLLGRRPLEQRLQQEVQRMARTGGSFALLSIDIDHFKAINDRYGHAAGDAVLVRLAQALRADARQVDSVARMGGEEFCVLLPGADRAGAEEVARRLLEAVRLLRHPEADAALQVTVSIGMAVRNDVSEPLQDLQRRADQAMYAAKAGGRDCVQPTFELA